ncbi:MAG: ATP-grasp domain-containing protein [Candidatus Bathyarchaeia archaeon]
MSSCTSVNILFTSVGRRVELILAFKKAYQQLGISGKIVGTDINPLAPALRVVDKSYVVPPISSEDEYLLALIEICQREQISLVFPLIDPDIPFLARHRRRLEDTSAKVVVVPERAAIITRDKWLTYQFLRELKIPTPRTWLPSEIKNTSPEYPLFIKPRSGSAAKQTFKINNARELYFFLDYVTDPIVQEYLPGPEITNDVVCDFQGNVLAVVSRQRLEVRGGEVTKGKTVYDPRIIQYCLTIAKGLKAIGPITVQCILREGEPYFTEINARFGGGVPLAFAAGVPIPKWFLSMAAGMPYEVPSLGTYKVGLYITRFDNSFFIEEEEICRSCKL